MDPTLDPYTARLFQIESGGNPRAVTGSNMGLGQFGPSEQKQYGITDPFDPQQQANAVARERAAHTQIYQNRFGSAPTDGQLYLMHQQGVAGGPALMGSDPSVPAWQAIRPYYRSDAIAQQAITGNIPRGSPLYGRNVNDITAGDFSNFWINKFEGAPTAIASASPSSGTASAPMPSAAPAPQPAAASGTDPRQRLAAMAQQQLQPQPLQPAPIPSQQLTIPQGLALRSKLQQLIQQQQQQQQPQLPPDIAQNLINIIGNGGQG